jgi:hypothetical protein
MKGKIISQPKSQYEEELLGTNSSNWQAVLLSTSQMLVMTKYEFQGWFSISKLISMTESGSAGVRQFGRSQIRRTFLRIPK